MIRHLKKIRDFLLVRVKWRQYRIGRNFHSGRGVSLWAKNGIVIGDNFYIGKYSIIECDAEIGNNVILANRVALIGRYDHNYQQVGVPVRLASQIRDADYKWKGLGLKTIIGDDVWIGYGVIILSGVKIGKGSIIAAGSVILKDVEPYSVYAGVPAKKVADRFDTEDDLAKHIKLYNQNYGS